MKLVLRTSDRTITEMNERCDRLLTENEQHIEVLNILITALSANGKKLCGDSDVKWEIFEHAVIRQFRSCRRHTTK